MTRLPRTAATLAVLAAVLVGAGLRLALMFDRALNYDEAATAYFAGLSLADLWGDTGRLETNPPLFYTLVGLLARLGMPAEYFRLAAVVPDVASIALAAALAGRLGGGFAAAAAAWLVATSPMMLDVGLEARAYALLAMLGLAMAVLAVRVLDGGGRRDLVLLALAEIAALYTHNTAVIMLAAVNGMALLCWLGRPPRDRALAARWLVVQGVVAVAWLPWLPVVVGQASDDLAQFWIARPGLMALRYEFQRLGGQPMVRWPQPLADLVFLGLAGLGLLRVWLGARRDRGLAVGLAVMLLAGAPIATWLISQWRPLMNGRVLLWLVPFFLVLVAVALGWRARWAAAVLAALLAVQLSTLPARRAAREAEPWREVAAMLNGGMRAGDALYLSAAPALLVLAHHGWRDEGHRLFAAREGRWYRRFPGTILAPDAAAAVLAKAGRLWIVTRRDSPAHDALVARLAPAMAEARLLRAGPRPDSGLDVSLLRHR
ncbi:MAG: glycosyltransferase family 39 protein [Acetobacteraceae bacterium]|nr:glycosyltransferase family 39 protein [Acetobacteraceae bacterium]